MARTIQPEILDEFIREAKGYIPVIRRELNAWIADPSRIEHIGEAHRLIHSIKGSASMMGYSALGHIGYYVEECLEELAPGQMEWNEGASRVLRKTIDTIEYYLSAITSGTLQDRPLVAEVVSNFRRVRGLPESGDQAEVESLIGAAASGPAPPARTEAVANLLPEGILESFRQEAEEYLQQAGDALRAFEAAPDNREILLQVRRPVHALKGAAGVVGLSEANQLAHRMQMTLDRINENQVSVTGDIVSLFFSTCDALSDLTIAGGAPAGKVRELFGTYDALLGLASEPVPAPAAPKTHVAAVRLIAAREQVEPELLAMFRPEADELLAKLSENLRAFQGDPDQ